MRRTLYVLLVPLALIALLLVNTSRQPSRQLQVPPLQPLAVDGQAVALRLAAAIRTQTLAHRERADQSAGQFLALHEHLRRAYPLVHSAMKREVVSDFSLLYTLTGSNPKARPILLMAHQDVVPVSSATLSKWTHPPFDGVVQDGFVWGRGAWDNKGNLIAQMEALELLLSSGFGPERTIYLAYGADEEVGGLRGAAQIAKLLGERGVQLEFVLDEGLVVTDGVIPGLKQPAALIGIAEKGSVALDLRVEVAPGHASMPPPGSRVGAAAIMSDALRRLDNRQMPASLRGVALEMFSTLAPEMSGINRVVLSNLWLFAPLVKAQLQRAAATDAMLRTTTALTVMRAGDAENVLPGNAEAIVNYRLAPGDTLLAVQDHVKTTVDNDRVEVKPRPGAVEASPVAGTDSQPYQLLNRTVREVLPDVVVAPGMMIAGTDARHFVGISEQVFRFSPVRAKAEDLPRLHGIDERIATSNLVELVRFYHRLIDQGSRAVH